MSEKPSTIVLEHEMEIDGVDWVIDLWPVNDMAETDRDGYHWQVEHTEAGIFQCGHAATFDAGWSAIEAAMRELRDDPRAQPGYWARFLTPASAATDENGAQS